MNEHSPKPVIEARCLSKWFGEVVALNNLTVSIEPGVTGVLGPNGAGKSTFIKLALGLYAPSRGEIRVLGEPPRNNYRVLSRIGWCPEVDHFYDHISGFEFVYWLCRYWGMSPRAAETAAERAGEMVRITDRMDDPVDEYSKGMRQRIKIAQALALSPELIFLDEPMNGLDPRSREEMYALIRELGNRGISVLVSSHILYEIERITDNVVLLIGGALIAQGRVREIRELIDRYPHTIQVLSDQPALLAKRFAGEPGVFAVETKGSAVTIRTLTPDSCYDALNALAAESPDWVRSIECVDNNLQAVFDYLTRKNAL
ncbi:MAG TPA: ABC transporter ATP-binding protein [Candidatus Hydrogenedentes bacterium]|nr:ABC transporter ATP-binding protein [Candidatus Hydrogenedentota bacterium]